MKDCAQTDNVVRTVLVTPAAFSSKKTRAPAQALRTALLAIALVGSHCAPRPYTPAPSATSAYSDVSAEAKSNQSDDPDSGFRGPDLLLFGDGGNARRIVFVCDGSGAMINKLSALRPELLKAIEPLVPAQQFNLVFFQDGAKFVALNRDALRDASDQNKLRAVEWLDDVMACGVCDPVPAIEAAMRMTPDLIYFLADGEFNNLHSYEEIGRVFAAGTAANSKLRVNFVLFEAFDLATEEAMKRMATQNRGAYRFVRLVDLESPPSRPDVCRDEGENVARERTGVDAPRPPVR